jgi:Ca2+-binding RTX toxin-like protein
MNGGLGADVFLGSEGNDLVNGGDGDDVEIQDLGADNVTSARRADAAWFVSHPDLAQLIPNAISS